MSLDSLKQLYLNKYTKSGKDIFYKYLLLCFVEKLLLISNNSYKGVSPELEYLNYYDNFIILYRREGNEDYLIIANLFRKAAHKMYRIMLKNDMIKYNSKFLNLV